MIKQLRIQNFKGWQDTNSIRMAPITLFFGTNSSGKSSIGHFLMMLKQTVELPDRKTVLFPGTKNSAVQLGSFQEMINERNTKKRITFSYEWERHSTIKLKDPYSGRNYNYNRIRFSAEVGSGSEFQNAPVVQNFSYDLKQDEDPVLSIGMEKKNINQAEYIVNTENYELKRNKGRAWSPGSPVRFYGFPDEVVAYHQNADFVQSLNLVNEKLFRSIHYLGPLRTKADRLYSWAGMEPESVGYSGENTIASILAARNRKISFGYKKKAYPFEQVIAKILQSMELIEDFKVSPITKHRQDYEVKVRTRVSREWVDLPDVGFGISQVLPVLVQCFYAPENSIIIMEQPEIHLHPNAQALLADAMIKVINSRENGSDRNIQLIIETHSEYFLRRLQRRIAEEQIAQEKVAAYFAKVDRIPAMLEGLEIDEYGNILNWPNNFFGDEMRDIVSQVKAAAKRRE